MGTNNKKLRNYSIPRSSLCESLNSCIIALPCSDSTLTYNVSVKSWKLFLSAIRFNINATCWLPVAILKRKAQGFQSHYSWLRFCKKLFIMMMTLKLIEDAEEFVKNWLNLNIFAMLWNVENWDLNMDT